MTKMKLLAVSAFCLPLLTASFPAAAVTAHRLQSGMESTNTHSDEMGGRPMGGMKKMKKMKMHKKMM